MFYMATEMQIGGHTVRFIETPSRKAGKAPHVRFELADGRSDHEDYRSIVQAIEAAKRMLGVATASTPATAATPAPQTHRQAARPDGASQWMGGSFGLTSPSARDGRCHFCGQRVNRRGQCEECV